MELEKKICIITGAAKGVGRATSLRFSREGAVVVLVDILEKELRELAERIHDSGQESVTMRADLSDSHDIRRAVERTMIQFGRIDVLVNNAGIVGPTKKSWEIQDRYTMIRLTQGWHLNMLCLEPGILIWQKPLMLTLRRLTYGRGQESNSGRL